MEKKLMKHLVYFSGSATTSGRALSDGNLMKAGRIDIAIHTIIQGLFLSHDFRKDTKMHLIFYGMPDPPKHIEIQVKDGLDISKKDVGNLLKKTLYKYREGKKTEVFPGIFIEKKGFLQVIEELKKEGNQIFVLEKKGKDIRKEEISENCVFILGDHDGLPKKEIKRILQYGHPISIGPKMYFASQTVAVLNNELDYRGI
jgi:tRNA pseudouridine-54 N-methylase